LKKKIARAITTRTIPNLVFKQDKGLDNAIRVNELLKQISGSGHES
jgi:ribosome-binding factor A